ncbi:hypothetical protein [Patulibacter defluvii]|uniref:hypothetical protein n=1 Tax=Patulibacter defluvii TaxID=3095358 RepID=UPI002A74F1F4|nr:hypothetical protein [Patulibacter sp. DM4]
MDSAPALVRRPDAATLVVGGPEAVAFLEAHLTAPVLDLRPGDGRPAAMLAPKGTLLGIVRVRREPSRVLLEADRATLDAVAPALARGTIGWQVELERDEAVAELALLGAGAAALVVGDPLAADGHAAVELAGRPLTAIGTADGIDLRLAAADVDAVAAELLARGAVAADHDLDQRRRVERGRPAFGAELDERTLPHEAGLVPAVVTTEKGLYPGMQTVLRQQRSGTVHRAVRRLRPTAPVAAGDPVVDGEGREVGRVGTAVVSPDHGPLALALLRTSAAPGTTVAVAGTAATVEEADDLRGTRQ